jgi:predicted acyl esterase
MKRFDAALEIAGRPLRRLEFASTAPSSHLFAKLQDVSPDGTTRPISRCEAMVPAYGDELLVLLLSDIAYRFNPGHAIQLQIQSSDYPYYLVHPGIDENPRTTNRFVVAEQSVTVGGSYAACLTLPVLQSAA